MAEKTRYFAILSLIVARLNPPQGLYNTLELELELIQTQMTQKPLLRVEVGGVLSAVCKPLEFFYSYYFYLIVDRSMNLKSEYCILRRYRFR